MESWAAGEWFTDRNEVPESIKMVVFKVTEKPIPTISPLLPMPGRAPISRCMPWQCLKWLATASNRMTRNYAGPLKQIEAIKSKGLPVAFVGDVVGTGSSRKSANSVLWYFGEDTPGIPNKRAGGVCIGGKVAPIFYNTMEDAGALVFEAPVDQLAMGEVIETVLRRQDPSESGEVLSEFALRSRSVDEVRAGGRINLIIGRGLTSKAREALGLGESELFRKRSNPRPLIKATRWRKKWWARLRRQGNPTGHVLRATHDHRRLSGHYWPDDTRLQDLACLGFSADLTMQSFCLRPIPSPLISTLNTRCPILL